MNYEKFAVYVLTLLFPDKFTQFQKSENPDWICGDIGLEVTRGMTTQKGDLHGLVKQYLNKEREQIPDARLKKLGFSTTMVQSVGGCFYELRSNKNGTLLFYPMQGKNRFIAFIGRMCEVVDCTKYIKSVVQEKLKKLNDHYRVLHENDLAIILEEQLDYEQAPYNIPEDVFKHICNAVKEGYKVDDYPIRFAYIFVIFSDFVCAIDTKEFSYTYKKISNDIFYRLTAEAAE